MQHGTDALASKQLTVTSSLSVVERKVTLSVWRRQPATDTVSA